MDSLDSLWLKIDDCKECRSKNNKLKHILGNGCTKNPKFCFIFINPTHRNISSKPDYKGPRSPFLGTKEVWKVFVNSKLLNKSFLEKTKEWNKETIDYVLNELKNKRYYMTNIVKCTRPNADLPKSKEVNEKLEILKEEISIVDPELIVTFGIIPFKAITGISLKLKDHLEKQNKSKSLILYDSIEINNKRYKVFPCYFPVGRGNPKKAAEILNYLYKP